MLSTSHADLKRAKVPTTVGRYDLVAELASGGMGSVWLARSTGIGGFEKLVAVKVCSPILREDPEFVRSFLAEARLAARIRHPNVVSTLDVGEEEVLFLVMEYVEGASVAELLHARHKGAGIPMAIAVKIAMDLLAGLHAAHELQDDDGNALGLVHRDVSPQNVLVGVDGVSRVVDFGIAKAQAQSQVTKEGTIKGKFGYMAPEQMSGGAVSRRADLFAVGVVLWEMLSGRRLFKGGTQTETAGHVLYKEAPAPSRLQHQVPPSLDAVVLRLLDKAAERRYGSAAEASGALENCGLVPASAREVGSFVDARVPELLTSRRALFTHSRTRPRGAPGQSLEPVSGSPPARGGRKLVPLFGFGLLVAILAGAVFAWRAREVDRGGAVSRAEVAPDKRPAPVVEPRQEPPAAARSAPEISPPPATTKAKGDPRPYRKVPAPKKRKTVPTIAPTEAPHDPSSI